MKGFTLIETLVAISLLTIAIVAPMALVSQSLNAAYYARDQVTAYNLAQEGIEATRAIRDGNILSNAINNTDTDILTGIPIDTDFTIDTRQTVPASAITTCSGTCPALQTDGTLYGYTTGWPSTIFTRTLHATYVGGSHDEIRLAIKVSWLTSNYKTRSFTIYENMYRWIQNGSASS